MGQEIVYCNVCGERILESDFRKGKAVTLLKKNYCGKCSRNLAIASAGKDIGQTSAVKTPSPRRLQMRSVPPAEERSSPYKKSSLSMPYIIAIGIGILVVILLIVVLARSGPPK